MLLENGFLRYIKHGDVELIRMINHAIRDENWETIPVDIIDLQVSSKSDSFDISYKASSKSEKIRFNWTCSIRGSSDHVIEFELSGMAQNSFLKNRLGFTVLHPISSCQGQPVVVKGSDGTTREENFPIYISPHQPFIDIREMRWSTTSGQACLIFEGDTFEIEDQRNWGDSSFKTYCTPLALPIPVQIKQGDVVTQRITLKYNPAPNIHPATSSTGLTFHIEPKELDMPKLGLCASVESELITISSTCMESPFQRNSFFIVRK